MNEETITGQESEKKWQITPTTMIGTLGVAGTAGIVDWAAHLGPNGLLVGAIAALIAARHGEDIVNGVRDRIPQPILDAMAEKFGRRSGHPKEEQGIECQSVYPSLPQPSDVQTELLQEVAPYRGVAPSRIGQTDDEIVPTVRVASSDLFRFSELLDAGFPTPQKIFVGRTMDGKDIFVPAEDLCHVALAGKTGGGKGSLMRLLMVQLCYIGAKVLLLNPHYMRWVRAKDGPAFDEDWTPFEGKNPRTGKPYLEVPPVDCAEEEPIQNCLCWTVETLLKKRKTEGREGGKLFVPYFIVLDEWPDIASESKKAPGYMGKLLRQGRKYGIFVIVASQDFQVKTLGMEGEGGSVRKCLLTCFYTGGDPVTAKQLLYSENPSEIPENKLGKGVIMMRCVGTNNEAVLARVPFVDNAAVYRLLGPTTFKKQIIAGEEPANTPAQSQTSTPRSGALTIEQILDLYEAGKLSESALLRLIDKLPVVQTADEKPEAQPIATHRSSMPSQVLSGGVPYLRAMPPVPTDMEDIPMRPKETQLLPEVELEQERRQAATGRFTAALSPELQQAYDAFVPGMSNSKLGRALNVDKTTAGRRIQRLIDKGYVSIDKSRKLVG